jgi:hypothetical protein
MMAAKSEFEEKYELIDKMLDQIYPFPPDVSESDREAIDNERQMIVLRTGWGSMSVAELRALVAK